MSHGSTAAPTSPRRLPHALYPPPNKQNAGHAFIWMERYLDSASGGPRYLKQQNHVQLLVLPSVSPSRFLQTLKGTRSESVARTHGQPFWQRESYDHSVSDDQESNRIQRVR